ncbi:MAG: hypothetical protein RI922_1788 [Bacteroidota bacterium]|jgi:RHS repeat-associated protein
MYSNSSSIFSYSPYSFQGQEHDDEVKGDGNSVNYKYRMCDPRVGRFFAVDPLASQIPHYSPYIFSGNKVLDSKEFEGLEDITAVCATPNVTVNSQTTAYYNKNNRASAIQNSTILFIGLVNNREAWIYRRMTATEITNLNIGNLRTMNTPMIIKESMAFDVVTLVGPDGGQDHIAHTGQQNSTGLRRSTGILNFAAGSMDSPNTVTSVVSGDFTDGNATQAGVLTLPTGANMGTLQLDGTATLNVQITDNLGGTVYNGTIAGFAGTNPTLTPGSTSFNVQVTGSTSTADNFTITSVLSGPMNNATTITPSTASVGSTTSTNSGIKIIAPVPQTGTDSSGTFTPSNQERSYSE